MIARLRQVYEAVNSGDLDGIMECFHDDVEYLPFEESETLHGLDAVRRYFEGWLDTWDPFQVEPTEFLVRGATMSSPERPLKGGARAAASRSPCRAGRYRSCAMALSFAGTSSWTVTRPSKPPGSRSRRCRRRTWRTLAGATRR